MAVEVRSPWATCWKDLPALLVPGILLLVPLTLPAAMSLPAVAGDDVAVVDGRVWPTDVPGVALLAWMAVFIVLGAAGSVLSLGAASVIVAARAFGRPVSGVAAVRACLGRRSAVLRLSAIVATGALVVAGVLVAGIAATESLEKGVGLAAEQATTAQTVWRCLMLGTVALVPVAAVPVLLAVPGAFLGLGVRRAFARSRAVARVLGSWGAWRAGLLAVIVGLSPIALYAVPLPVTAAALALVPLVPAVQAVLLTVRFLRDARTTCSPVYRDNPVHLDLEVIRAALPDQEPVRRKRTILLVAGLVVPGALLGSLVIINPGKWREISHDGSWQKTVDRGRGTVDRRMVVQGDDFDAQPDPRAVLAGKDGVPSILLQSEPGASARFLTCRDWDCREQVIASTQITAHPRTSRKDYVRIGGEEAAGGGVILADTHSGAGNVRTETALWWCAPRATCVQGEPVVAAAADLHTVGVAVTSLPDGRSAVADLRFTDEREGGRRVRLSIATCQDWRCARPSGGVVKRWDIARGLVPPDVPMDVALTRDGRAVVAHADPVSGAVELLICDSPRCRNPRVSRPVPPAARPGSDQEPVVGRVQIGLLSGDRPVIVYQRHPVREAVLLTCRSADCGGVDAVTLPVYGLPSREDVRDPAMIVDRTGRVLVAGTDADGTAVLLTGCREGRCVSAEITRQAKAGSVALGLDPAGRPVVAWTSYEIAQQRGYAVHLTTVAL